MEFVVIGISHKTAPVEIREKFSFTKAQIQASQAKLREISAACGVIILSTCNRVEIYAHSSACANSLSSIKKFIVDKFNLCEEDFQKYFYVLEDISAITHIFRVACGLDSQVLGELEILGQVKSAFSYSRDSGLTDDFLNRVFEKAIETGVCARRDTKLSYGNVSIGSVAVKVLKKRFDTLQGKSVLIIGAGKVASLMSKYLKEENIRGFFISSRSYAKACELASSSGAEALGFNSLPEKLKTVNIVISSTTSPHLILKKELIENAMNLRREPLLLLDLAVPRDIDPGVKAIANVTLFDLDDLKSVIEENYNKRKNEARLVEEIIEREIRPLVLCDANT